MLNLCSFSNPSRVHFPLNSILGKKKSTSSLSRLPDLSSTRERKLASSSTLLLPPSPTLHLARSSPILSWPPISGNPLTGESISSISLKAGRNGERRRADELELTLSFSFLRFVQQSLAHRPDHSRQSSFGRLQVCE